MSSLRARLWLAVGAVVFLTVAALAVAVSAALNRALEQQLDAQLLEDAQSLSSLVEFDETYALERGALADFDRAERPAYFVIWQPDGAELARSGPFPSTALPPLAPGPRAVKLTLPDGRHGRALQRALPCRLEDGSPGPPVTILTARGTEDVDEVLRTVRGWLLGLALLAALLGASTAAIAISAALRPTRLVGERLARLPLQDLARGLQGAHVPDELAPLVTQLDAALRRLGDALAREERFAADASHELRTPLAALRTTLEVALSDGREPATRETLTDCLALTLQLQRLVEALLALARAGQPGELPRTEVDLPALVDRCLEPLRERARARGLRVALELPSGARWHTHAPLLERAVGNLLDNAVAYTEAGGLVTVRLAGQALEVADSGPPLSEALLRQRFERFARSDAARENGEHFGLGLSIAHASARALGLDLTAHNPAAGGVCFRLAPR